MIFSLVFRVLVVLLAVEKLYSVEHAQLAPQEDPSQWHFFADALFLKADEVATWAINIDFMPYTTSSGASAVNFSETPKAVTFDWNCGVRTGLGYRFAGDRWDTRLYYTWFQTEGKDSARAVNADANITPALLGQWLTFGFASSAGRIHWHILLNSVDWELGRDCPVSQGVSFRPYLGLKGAWIHQTVRSHWISTAVSNGISTQYKATENLKNDFWGVGPKGGVSTDWLLGSVKAHSFHLFADASLALLGGQWILKDIQKTSMHSSIVSINPSTWAATFMFYGLMGLSWDVQFNKNRSNVGIGVGYEFQYWYDQLKIFTFLEGTLHAALVLQGGMLDIHVNY